MRRSYRLLCVTPLVTLFAAWSATEAEGLYGSRGRTQDPVVAPGAAPPGPPSAVVDDDTRTLDGLIDALYDVLSGPAGQARDWDRLRKLFHREARMVPIGPSRGIRGPAPAFWTVEDYIEGPGPRLEAGGFYETEIARRIERFGHLAQVFSTYEIRRDLAVEKPLLRGVNGIQAVFSQGRWWILQTAWEQESDAGEWPARYRPGAAADTPLEPAAFERETDGGR